MAHSPISRISTVLHGSTAGMITLPDSFPNPLTNCRDISVTDIETMTVSQLLEHNVLHQGFVYKRGNNKKTDKVAESVDNVLPIKLQLLNRWQLRYVIIYSHYVIYYKDDRGKKPVGFFSLRDYNRVVRAEEMVSADRKWPFKVIGMRASARTWYFCAASEREMKLWMACFKVTMDHAIHGKVKQRCLDIISTEQNRVSPEGDESTTSASSTGSSGERFFQDDDTYDDLESPTTNMENPDDNYDDIVSEDESGNSGGDSSSGSGGRVHPPLAGVSSAANAVYEVATSADLRASLRQRGSYFTDELEDYLDIMSDDEYQAANAVYEVTTSADLSASLRQKGSYFSNEPEDYLAIMSEEEYQGKRVNSDPPRRHYRNNSPTDARTTPKPNRRLPTSPGSRPKFPEPGPRKENYDYPGPKREPPEPPARPQMTNPVEGTTPSDVHNLIQNLQRQGFTSPRPRTANTGKTDNGLKRQGPDGDSFRHKVPPEEVSRQNRPKPAAYPRPPAKPKPADLALKPNTPPKPPVAAKKTKDPLPKSALLDTCDKDHANELLRKHGHNGMYLVRGSARDPTKQVVMVWDKMAEKSKHYTIFGDQKTSFALDQNAQFATLLELIEYYSHNYLPNTNLKLTRPCPG